LYIQLYYTTANVGNNKHLYLAYQSASAYSHIHTTFGINSLINGVTAISNSGYTNGATLTSTYYLQLGEATTTYPGLITTTGQTFAGDKYFGGSVGVSGLLQIGNYSTAPTSGVTGTLYYDTTVTGATGFKISDGTTWQNVKSFVIDHPNDNEKYLVHGCLEGPEAGVYYRGEGKITNDDNVVIELPDYVNNLTTFLTVQLTPIYDGNPNKKSLHVSRVLDNKFTVYGENGEFFWTVFGKRQDIIVEPKKSDVNVSGDGPYKWIKN
jgi:hypothetical protein